MSLSIVDPPDRRTKRYHEKSPGVWVERYVLRDGDVYENGPKLSPGLAGPGTIVQADGTRREVHAFGYPGEIEPGYVLYLKVTPDMLSPVTRTELEPPGGRDAMMA